MKRTISLGVILLIAAGSVVGARRCAHSTAAEQSALPTSVFAENEGSSIAVGKEVHYRIKGTVDYTTVNARLAQLTDTSALRHSGPIAFREHDGEGYDLAKLYGDDWDFAVHLKALRALAAERGDIAMSFVLDDGSPPHAIDEHAVTTFLEEMDGRPRPQWDGLYHRLTYRLSSGDARAVAERYASLTELYPNMPQPVVEGLTLTFATDGTTRVATAIVRNMTRALVMTLGTEPPRTVLELSGRATRTYVMEDGSSWFVPEAELFVAEGD